jgi:hypothetical protein
MYTNNYYEECVFFYFYLTISLSLSLFLSLSLACWRVGVLVCVFLLRCDASELVLDLLETIEHGIELLLV